ncbi:MAG TPA: ATPase domain-containing protein [Gemmatimonadales bacterium]|jgi:circadian clock protein KaiC
MSDGLRRVTTGNVGADAILGGGFPANSINIVMGAPGTGKTMFAQQLAVHNADPERPVLYLTTLSEPLAKVVTYLQQLTFYDENKIGSAIRYEDLSDALMEHGVGVLVSRLRDAIMQISPSIIIIDSFKAVHDLSTSVAEMRRFVADLAGLLTAYDTTTFLVGEYEEEEIGRYPEFAVADAIIEFARHKRSNSDERYARVSKLRGASYREGLHAFRVTSGGLEFFPRLVSPEFPRDYRPSPEKISTGIAGLDAMLGGGLWRGTTTLVAGPTGAGKTTTAIQFCLEGIRKGEPILYMNFQENPVQLGRLVQSLGGELDDSMDERWHAIYTSPVELQIDSLIGGAFAMIKEKGIRRVAVDGVGDLLLAAGDPQRVHDYLYALTQHFARNGVSSLLTFETGLGIRTQPGNITDQLHFSALTDCIILLDLERVDRLRRSACVIKARNSAHDLAIREIEITAKGLEIG